MGKKCFSYLNCVRSVYIFTPPDTDLNSEPFQTAFEKLFDVRNDWYNLGHALNIDTEDLRSLKGKKPDECLREILTIRRQRGGPLTLREVCTALRARTVGRSNAADKIERSVLGLKEGGECSVPQLRVIE